jgi:hypothetical protein
MNLSSLLAKLAEVLLSETNERSLLEGSELTGDMNFRTDRFDCSTDPGGFYEDDL